MTYEVIRRDKTDHFITIKEVESFSLACDVARVISAQPNPVYYNSASVVEKNGNKSLAVYVNGVKANI